MSTCAFSKYLLHEWYTYIYFISQIKGAGMMSEPPRLPSSQVSVTLWLYNICLSKILDIHSFV